VRILVVEDEIKMAGLIKRGLEHEGYAVDVARDGPEALWAAREVDYDAIVLDVMIPEPDGFEVCRTLRKEGRWAPVVLLTARDRVDDRVTGLDAGADDYLTKPFAFAELLARVSALARRPPIVASTKLAVGDLELDRAGHRALRGDRDLMLTRRELELLSVFMRHPGQVIGRERLHEEVWGYDFDPKTNVADVFVGYLRRKLEAGGEPRVLHTVRGVGFVLRP
jgi:two-component system OmpR family response regulator